MSHFDWELSSSVKVEPAQENLTMWSIYEIEKRLFLQRALFLSDEEIARQEQIIHRHFIRLEKYFKGYPFTSKRMYNGG
jgi:hypothetical protein